MRRTVTRIALALAIFVVLAGAAEALPFPSLFDVQDESTFSGPPYPTPPVVNTVAYAPSGTPIPVHRLEMGLQRCADGVGVLFSADCLGDDGGGPPGTYGDITYLDVFFVSDTNEPRDAPQGPPPLRSFIDLFVNDLVLSTGMPGTLVPLVSSLPENDPGRYFLVSHDAGSFQVVFESREGYQVQGYTVQGTTLDGLSFFDVFVELDGVAPTRSSFDLHVIIDTTGPVDPFSAMMTLSAVGQFRDETVGVAPMTWASVKSLYAR